jgi:2-oxoisovalerate dehydrogenase E1 component
MPAPSKEDKLRLLSAMMESRHSDLREQNLIRQGKGHFHVSGMGHEALAAVSIQMQPDDYIVSYYRDRGLVLGRGMTTRQLGLEYFAKRNTGSGGRQMPSHYSNADLHIWRSVLLKKRNFRCSFSSKTTPTALACLRVRTIRWR